MHKKVFLYYNPQAGNKVLPSKLDYIISEFQKAGQIVVPFRSRKNENISKLFKSAKIEEYSKLIVSGGDGTIHKIAHELVKNEIDIPLGLLPAGTANDYAFALKIPVKLEDAIKIAVLNKYKEADIGIVNDDFFINVFALGQVVTLSQSTDPNAKNALGPLAYYLNGISKLHKIKPFDLTIESAEQEFSGKAIFALVLNGQSAGGFNKLAPFASLEDGLLDIVIFKDMAFYDFPVAFANVLAGNIVKNKNIITWQTKEANITAKKKVPTDVDGETGTPLPARVSILQRKLKVITNG